MFWEFKTAVELKYLFPPNVDVLLLAWTGLLMSNTHFLAYLALHYPVSYLHGDDQWPALQMAATADLAALSVCSQDSMLCKPTYSASAACLPHPPACHSPPIIAGEWARIRLDNSIIPTQEGKKIWNAGKTKGLHHLDISNSARVYVCLCARMLMCTRVQYVDVQSHVSFISHWVHSCLFSLTAATLH